MPIRTFDVFDYLHGPLKDWLLIAIEFTTNDTHTIETQNESVRSHQSHSRKHVVMPKRKANTFRKKLDLITRIRNGESQIKVSREMCVAESTLRGWLTDEAKLREFAHTVQDYEALR